MRRKLLAGVKRRIGQFFRHRRKDRAVADRADHRAGAPVRSEHRAPVAARGAGRRGGGGGGGGVGPASVGEGEGGGGHGALLLLGGGCGHAAAPHRLAAGDSVTEALRCRWTKRLGTPTYKSS